MISREDCDCDCQRIEPCDDWPESALSAAEIRGLHLPFPHRNDARQAWQLPVAASTWKPSRAAEMCHKVSQLTIGMCQLAKMKETWLGLGKARQTTMTASSQQSVTATLIAWKINKSEKNKKHDEENEVGLPFQANIWGKVSRGLRKVNPGGRHIYCIFFCGCKKWLIR